MTTRRNVTKEEILAYISQMPEGLQVDEVCSALKTAVDGTQLPPPPLYTKWRLGVSRLVTVVSGTAAVITALAVILNIWADDVDGRQQFFKIYAFWALAPPVWFLVEYTVLYDGIRGNPQRDQDFKNSQELSQRIWAAFLVLLGVYALVNWGTRF